MGQEKILMLSFNERITMAKEFAKKFYNSKHWQSARENALMRDNYLCCRCGEPAEEVHHITRLNASNISNPLISININNLECLCRSCHFDEHNKERIAVFVKKDCSKEFEFDSNGYLIKINTPPIN